MQTFGHASSLVNLQKPISIISAQPEKYGQTCEHPPAPGKHKAFLCVSTGRFGDSIARQPNLWPGTQLSAGTIDLQAVKQIQFMR